MPEICAVRLPGTSRARLARLDNLAVQLGEWVAVSTEHGEEAGRIVVAPAQWLEEPTADDVLSVIRQLTDDEIDHAGVLQGRALTMIDLLADVLRQVAPDSFLSGVRFDLTGARLILSYFGEIPNEPAVTEACERVVSKPIALEREPNARLLGGGTGRIHTSRPETFRELFERRFDVLRDPQCFAPHGYPRMGSRVATPHGNGQLVSVDIRHGNATVSLDAGEEVTVPASDLTPPD